MLLTEKKIRVSEDVNDFLASASDVKENRVSVACAHTLDRDTDTNALSTLKSS